MSSATSLNSLRLSTAGGRGSEENSRPAALAAVVQLRQNLERPPAVPIEEAATLLNMSVRTLYRRRGEFEHRRQRRHLYFTLRGIKQYIEIEQYNPTPSYDVTNSDVFDMSASVSSDNRDRQA